MPEASKQCYCGWSRLDYLKAILESDGAIYDRLAQLNTSIANISGGGSSPTPVSLDNLVAHYTLNEFSGNRLDSSANALTLTQNNGVSSIPGKLNDAANFVSASNQFLSHADDPLYQFGDEDFTFCFWVKFSAVTSGQAMFAKWTSGTDREYEGYLTNSGGIKFAFDVRKADNSATVTAIATTFGLPVTGVWYFVVMTHDATNDRIGISVNNGAFDYTAITGGCRTSNNDFTLGAVDTGANQMDGNLNSFSIFRRLLSTTEVSNLYNNYEGQYYPFGN